MTCDPGRWGVVGGDVEPPRLLDVLARRHPDDQFYMLGRTPPESPQDHGLPDNVVNPWIELDPLRKAHMANPARNGTQLADSTRRKFVQWVDENVLPLYAEMDAVVCWLGQHGSVHAPGIPKVNGTWADPVTPQDWAVLYGSLVVRGINMFRKRDPHKYEEIWLVSDARNYLKMHDLKWPLRNPILGQYNMERDFWVQRYGDPRTPADVGFADLVKGHDKGDETHWKTTAQYVASGLEIGGILPQHTGIEVDTNYDRKHHFGLFINETRAVSGIQRADVLRDWVRPNAPDWVHGKWTEKGLETALFSDIQPIGDPKEYFQLLRDTRCTFTTPASGGGWATAKPWEAFSVGTVCFRHPTYDDQDNVYGRFSSTARDWLTPKSPGELFARLHALETDETTWRWLVQEQRRVFDEAAGNPEHVRLIEERIWK